MFQQRILLKLIVIKVIVCSTITEMKLERIYLYLRFCSTLIINKKLFSEFFFCLKILMNK